MNKYEKIYLKAAEKHASARWLDSAIAALAVDLEEFTKEPVEVSGPFGLRAEVTIKVGDCYTTLTPSFVNGFKLYYDTGEYIERYPPQSLGDWNGLNNVQAPLPDTFAEIFAVMTHSQN